MLISGCNDPWIYSLNSVVPNLYSLIALIAMQSNFRHVWHDLFRAALHLATHRHNLMSF